MKPSIKTIGLLAAIAAGFTSPLFSQVPDPTKDSKAVPLEHVHQGHRGRERSSPAPQYHVRSGEDGSQQIAASSGITSSK